MRRYGHRRTSEKARDPKAAPSRRTAVQGLRSLLGDHAGETTELMARLEAEIQRATTARFKAELEQHRTAIADLMARLEPEDRDSVSGPTRRQRLELERRARPLRRRDIRSKRRLVIVGNFPVSPSGRRGHGSADG